MTTSQPETIEFVVPYVGGREFLERTVRSVLEQSDPAWRLTVVEDGPQGQDVAAWIEGLGDDRVSHVLNPHNLGLSANFQRCLELGESPWVVILGCDDLLLPNYVATIREALAQEPASAAVQPGVEVIDGRGRRVHPASDRVKNLLAPHPASPTALSGEALLTSLLRGNWTYFPAICWRRDAALRHGFRQDLGVCLDLELLANLVFDGEVLTVSSTPAFQYRRHAASASSLSARTADRFAEEAAVFNGLSERSRVRGWRRAERAGRRRLTSRAHAASLIPRALSRRQFVTARRLASHAVGT